jgi:NitT/TauT family transport system substrate-binding protein
MEDIVRATRWFIDPANRPEAIAMLAEATKRPAAELDTWIYTEKDSGRDPDAMPNLASMQGEAEAMKDAGFLKIDIDIKKYADLSIVEEAARRLK